MPSSLARWSRREASSAKGRSARAVSDSSRSSAVSWSRPVSAASAAGPAGSRKEASPGSAGRASVPVRAAHSVRVAAVSASASWSSERLAPRDAVRERARRARRVRCHQDWLTPRSARHPEVAVAASSASSASASAAYASGRSTSSVLRTRSSRATAVAVSRTVVGAVRSGSSASRSAACWRSGTLWPRSSARTVDAARASSRRDTEAKAAYQGWVSARRVNPPASA